MPPLVKVVVGILLMVVAGLFFTGFERIVWMFSGSGLVAVLPRDLYAPIADIRCDQPTIEIKRDADGVLRYRCGSYWLLAHGDRSPALSRAWPDLKRQLAH